MTIITFSPEKYVIIFSFLQKLMEVDLRLIQNKICHPVEEIRCRTVNSLLYKLDQKLVDPASLVNEDHLFRALLKSLDFGGTSVHQVCQLYVYRLN